MASEKKGPNRRLTGKEIAPSSIRPFHLHSDTLKLLEQIVRLHISRSITSQQTVLTSGRVYGEQPEKLGDNEFRTARTFINGSLVVYVNMMRIPSSDIVYQNGNNGIFRLSDIYPEDIYIEVDYDLVPTI